MRILNIFCLVSRGALISLLDPIAMELQADSFMYRKARLMGMGHNDVARGIENLLNTMSQMNLEPAGSLAIAGAHGLRPRMFKGTLSQFVCLSHFQDVYDHVHPTLAERLANLERLRSKLEAPER